MERHVLDLLGHDSKIVATLSYDEADEACHIRLEYSGKSLDAEGADFFDAFCSIRLARKKVC